jgi:lipid II:glycine glycyltransferase (peptidoglycan interpeptide bridge formation enzyme)
MEPSDVAGSWDRWVMAQANGHPLQLSGWAALKAQFGWTHRRVVLSGAGETPRAGAQVLMRRAYGVKLAYAPRGPLLDWRDPAECTALLDLLRRDCHQQGAAILKIEPALADTPANRALLRQHGFAPSTQSVQPPATIIVDLAPEEEAILAAMKSKWRYNIRLAERKGVTVRTMQRSDLASFHALMCETGVRDGFAVHNDDYFTAAFDQLAPEHAAFLLAEFAGEPIAAIVVAIAGKTAVYLWGASSERERSRMPNHALQWAGMRWARAHGATAYDLWGIPDDLGRLAMALNPEAEAGVDVDRLPIALDALPGNGLWGVYRFKQGFGGRVLRTVGAWDMALDPVVARVYGVGLAALEWKRAAGDALRAASTSDAASPADAARQRSAGEPVATNVTTAAIADAPRWRDTLAQMPVPHVLQSWEWGEIKAQTGWHAERLVAPTPAGAVAFQFLWREPIPSLPVRVAYIPKGPALDWTNLDLVDHALAAVETTARRHGCIFVKIDPDVCEDTTAGRLVLHALERRGWRYSAEQIQFKNSALTDLRGGEEAILAAMKSKWRYNIRLAEKRGVTVRQGSEADLTSFYALYAETSERDGFLIRPANYYLATWRRFLSAQQQADNPAGGALLLAEHADDPQPLAALFLLRYGETAWYFYGASSDRHRRDMPNHLLQWEAMRWAVAQGCTRYDWWGAPTVIDDPDDRMQGVWQFKQGFGAELQQHIGAWDFVLSPPGYRLVTQSLPYVLATLRRLRP